MAINRQNYKQYQGPVTSVWMRFLILSRFYYAPLFQSKFIVFFLTVCLFYPFACAAYIYITDNDMLIAVLSFQPNLLPMVDGRFFYTFSVIQGTMALLLTTFIGPNLIAPDLACGALCLYLSRPLSRVQYVLGKMAVLVSMQSIVTWIPALLLFLIKTQVAGFGWMKENLWMAGSIVIGFSVWIILLSIIAITLSAWVKWKIAAGSFILGLFFVGAGFGSAVNRILRTHYGSVVDLSDVIHTIWADLFRHGSMDTNLTVTQSWIVVCVTSAFCLYMLFKRVRAFEVVK